MEKLLQESFHEANCFEDQIISDFKEVKNEVKEDRKDSNDEREEFSEIFKNDSKVIKGVKISSKSNSTKE